MKSTGEFFGRETHPVDIIEYVACGNDWTFERTGDDEIAVCVTGKYTDYHISFSWIEKHEALHLACAFDLETQHYDRSEVTALLALINEQMLIGHFDYWQHANAIIFRQSLLLSGGVHPNSAQIETMLVNALNACEQYYQACSYVTATHLAANDALQYAMFDTHGNA